MQKKYYKLLALLLVPLFVAGLCGFAFSKPEIAVDTERDHVYLHITVESLLAEFSTNSKNAQEKYKGQYLLVSGLFESENKKTGGFSIINSNYDSIDCTFIKNLNLDVSNHSFKDKVAVYGKCTYSFGKLKLVDVEKIIVAPAVRTSETYFTLDGTSLDKSAALERTLNDGKVKFYIPEKWKDIEVNISEEGIGSMDGYQYVLNKTRGSSDTEPESLFICYLESDKLRYVSDMKNTDGVEKAIIENIEGSVGTFPAYKTTTSYGAKYQYYLGKFNDETEVGKGYRTEYIFQADGDRGIIMFLYLYREEKHLSDVLIAARMLEA